MKKLEKTELKEIQDIIQRINNLQMQIGSIEAQKHELLHAITDASTEFQVKQSLLKNKYGEVDIDITTGEIREKNELITKD